jgi:hypothetical protein
MSGEDDLPKERHDDEDGRQRGYQLRSCLTVLSPCRGGHAASLGGMPSRIYARM